MTRNGDPSTTLTYGLGNGPKYTGDDGRHARPSMHLPPRRRPLEPRQATRRPQPAPNFIPGIAPRSGPSFPYLAIALPFAHQFSTGTDFHYTGARVIWSAMYLAVTIALLRYRVFEPLRVNWRHRLRVTDV